MQPCRYEPSLGSKVYFGSPYLLAIRHFSSVSKELCSSRKPQKTLQNLREQPVKPQLQNNYSSYFHLCMTGHRQSPGDQRAVISISCPNKDCSSWMQHELSVKRRLTLRMALHVFLRLGCTWERFRKTLLHGAADL